jgi:TRAP transporter TAXI family solute receptor
MRKISLLMVLALICSVAVISVPSESEAARVFLNIGTTNKTSILYPYYVNMLNIFKKYAPDLKPTIIETGASVDNINRLVQKQIDIGMTVDAPAYEAYNGKGLWEGKPVSNLRSVMTFAVNTVPYVVTEESGITDPMDLTGKPVFPGMRGSGNEAQCEAIFGALGIEPDWFRGSLSDAADAMKDRRVICANKTSSGTQPDATFIELQTFLRLRCLEWTEEQVAKVREKYPYFKTGVQPANSLNAQTKDTITWAAFVGDVALAEIPEDTIYQYVKACFEGKEEQAKVYKVAGETDFVKATFDMGIPLHAGTVKYFREIGVEIPDSLLPPEVKK